MIISGIYPAFFQRRTAAAAPALQPAAIQHTRSETDMLRDIILVRMGLMPQGMTKSYYEILHKKAMAIVEEEQRKQKESNAYQSNTQAGQGDPVQP